ncbi:MAG TPA: hypothetical protein VFW18_08100 [Gaiellales bacterium]|nr:hypothetical protein [Gaiellales bacterium]
MKTTHLTGGRAARALPLAGVCAAVATVAGYMTIGPNPDGDARAATDVRYYTAHHTHILIAGILLTYAAVLSALFGVAVWDRIRRGRLHPAVGATALVAVAVTGVSDLTNAGAWYALGTMGGKDTIQPATFQTLHLAAAGSNLAAVAGFGLLLVVAGGAGVSARILPGWLAWSGLLLGVVELVQTPVEVGFIAGLLALGWMCAAGIAMFLRPDVPDPAGADRRPERIAEPALSGS